MNSKYLYIFSFLEGQTTFIQIISINLSFVAFIFIFYFLVESLIIESLANIFDLTKDSILIMINDLEKSINLKMIQ
jgi:uncharacterized protein YneF (UPF0154 family)